MTDVRYEKTMQAIEEMYELCQLTLKPQMIARAIMVYVTNPKAAIDTVSEMPDVEPEFVCLKDALAMAFVAGFIASEEMTEWNGNGKG